MFAYFRRALVAHLSIAGRRVTLCGISAESACFSQTRDKRFCRRCAAQLLQD